MIEIIKVHDIKDYKTKNSSSPIFENLKKEKILCIGEVQSGKTNKLISIVNESIDVGYNATIYLGGTNNLLTNQTIKRIKNEFSSHSNVLVINSDNFDWFISNYHSLINKYLIFVILKSSNWLNKILNNFLCLISLSDYKILFIDDECDYASNDIGDKNEHSCIFKLINSIWAKVSSGKMISISATPFANIKENVKLSTHYDRSILLNTNNDYTGIGTFDKNKDTSYYVIEAEKENWEKSIDNTLLVWLSTTAAAVLDNKEFKSELLINIDLKKPTHEKIKDFILKRIKIFFQYIGAYVFEKGIFPFDFNKQPYIRKISGRPIKKIIQQMKEIMKKFISRNENNIYVLNSNSNCEFVSGRNQFSIIIGGTLISRGYTFNNIVTELILNSPKNIDSLDTLLQRARWLGYRKDRLKYIRVLMNKKLFEAYNEAANIVKIISEYGNDLLKLEIKLCEIEKKLKYTRLTGKK